LYVRKSITKIIESIVGTRVREKWLRTHYLSLRKELKKTFISRNTSIDRLLG